MKQTKLLPTGAHWTQAEFSRYALESIISVSVKFQSRLHRRLVFRLNPFHCLPTMGCLRETCASAMQPQGGKRNCQLFRQHLELTMNQLQRMKKRQAQKVSYALNLHYQTAQAFLLTAGPLRAVFRHAPRLCEERHQAQLGELAESPGLRRTEFRARDDLITIYFPQFKSNNPNI